MAHRILVIDDAPDLALIMRMMLERAGHEVISAENGRRGLRRFYEDRPDLVVLDLRMPELDGGRTLERLRDLSDVPVLIVSGQNAEPRGVRAPPTRPGRLPGQARRRSAARSARSASCSPPRKRPLIRSISGIRRVSCVARGPV